jgi:hypothetical protein
MNVNFFTNHDEMISKIENVIEKNKSILLKEEPESIIQKII